MASTAGASSAPVPCLVGVRDPCWIWCSADSQDGAGLRDPSEIPENSKVHEERIAKDLFGPRWARLAEAVLLELKGMLALVQVRGVPKKMEVPATQLLQWYEGLLVLDEINARGDVRRDPKANWIAEFEQLLAEQRAKYKFISPFVFANKSLLDTAVTGPSFTDSDGQHYAHRRKLTTRSRPSSEEKPSEGLYRASGLQEYLPPWEAFTHPKCGFYQDFYLVKWAPPHDKIDYKDDANGGDELGSTWEPDECLSVDMDSLRALRKSEWLLKQKAREAKEREQELQKLQALKRSASTSDASEAQSSKVARTFNPNNLELIDDLVSVTVKNGGTISLKSEDETQITKGWPRKYADYAVGYGPADPPGCCDVQCNCMEDWHIGRIGSQKVWIADPTRDLLSEAALNNFRTLPHIVACRGTVTGKMFLQPMMGAAPTPEHELRGRIWRVATMVRETLQLAAKSVHPEALQTWPFVLRHLAQVFTTGYDDPDIQLQTLPRCGPIEPACYRIVGAEQPIWLALNYTTGAASVRDDDALKEFVRSGQSITIRMELDKEIPLPPRKSDVDVVEVTLDSKASPRGGMENHTSKIVAELLALPPGLHSLKEILQENLSNIFDHGRRQCKPQIEFGLWVETMACVTLLMRSASTSKLIA